MTKVLLINPFIKEYDLSAGVVLYFPIGLMSIAATIRNICEVKIFDCLKIDVKREEKEDFFLYGTPLDKIRQMIRDNSPDIVGISVPFSSQVDNAKIIAEVVKDINRDIIVVFGGPAASVKFDCLLNTALCDFCVVGEGEKTFYEFICNFNLKLALHDIDGLAYKIDNKICFRPRKYLADLDELPFPAYDLVDVASYLKDVNLYRDRSVLRNSMSIITSRGCPYQCVFCSIQLHMGNVYRYHSPEYVIDHIKLLRDKYKITNFHFEDDNISLIKSRFENILDMLIYEKIHIHWDNPNGMRADTLDFSLLKKIKKSGCQKLSIGIESGNQRVLDDIIRKNLSLERVFEVIMSCKKIGLMLNAFYVIGFPGETIENMNETIDLAMRLLRKYSVFPSMFIATPLYGTELYKICLNNKFIKNNLTEKDFATGTQLYGRRLIETHDFKVKDIEKIVNRYIYELGKALIIFSFKHPIYIARKFKDKFPALSRYLNHNLVKREMNRKS